MSGEVVGVMANVVCTEGGGISWGRKQKSKRIRGQRLVRRGIRIDDSWQNRHMWSENRILEFSIF